MSERLFAEDVASLRGVSLRQAQTILMRLEREGGPRAVGREGRRRYTTMAALSVGPEGDSDCVRRLRATEELVGELADQVDAQRRQTAQIERRLSSLEGRRQ